MPQVPIKGVPQFQRDARLEAFSDGVFAIAITLLVMGLAIPTLRDASSTRELFEALYDIRGKIVAYLFCFLFIGQLWVAHTNFFRLVARTDMTLLWLNNIVLMFMSLFPFAAALLGGYADNPGSVIVYGILFSLTGAAFGGMAAYCTKKGLYHEAAIRGGVLRGNRWATVVGASSFLPLTFAWAYPNLALGAYFALIVAYILMQRMFVIDLADADS